MWPGTTGASLTGGACGATEPADEGMRRLRDIMKGRSLPRWTELPNPRFVPDWTKEAIDLCNEVIKNTQQEQQMSSADHDLWRSKNRMERKSIPRRNWERQQQGWLDRKTIWDRPCGVGAVASIVIKIRGMQLKVDENGWVDRTGAAHSVKLALWTGAGPNDGFKESILDVVCSTSDKEQTGGENGPVRVTCIFYVRFPSFLGLVAYEQWIPRIVASEICECPAEAYSLFVDGKERMYGGHQHLPGWNITVGGVAPIGAGIDPSTVRNTIYNPESKVVEDMKDMAMKHPRSTARGRRLEILLGPSSSSL